MVSEEETVESLVELGLTEYEASCLVAITQLSQGTAKEISQIADVPQSRVYDVAEKLYRKGLVDIQESDPQKYYALPVDRAIKRLREEYRKNLETADENLRSLESRDRNDSGVWEIANREDVRIRVEMHVDEATEEIYFHVSHEESLESEILDALAQATDRGVVVRVEVPNESARSRVHETVPAARVAVSDLQFDSVSEGEEEPGRLLMVDRETILLSALTDGLVPQETSETGIWGSQLGGGLIAWQRHLLESRLAGLEFVTASD